MSDKAVPPRRNSIRVLSIKASPTLLCTTGAVAFFIKDDDGGDGHDASVSDTDPSVMSPRAINMLKIRRHSSAVVACVKRRCMSFASVPVKRGIEGGSIAGSALRDIDCTGESSGVCCDSERTSFPFPFTRIVKGRFSCVSDGTAVGITGSGVKGVSWGEEIS